jgi:membrane fusion protein (multidrug efflux system)
MIKRMLVMLTVAGVVAGAFIGFKDYVAQRAATFMAAGVPAQTVSATAARVETWQLRIDAVGSLRAVNGTDLSLELAGVVQEIGFHSGDRVQAGQALLRLWADDDVAKLRSLEANAQLAQLNYDRSVRQFKAQTISQATLDSDAATLKSNVAQADQQRALIEKKHLRAPFSGRLGIRQVDLGQYLAPGTTVVTLQSVDPIFVDFPLPQQAIARTTVGQPIKVRIDAWPGRSFTGRIAAISPKVDSSSRTLQVRATVANPDGALLPGMFAAVEIDAGAPQHMVTLPQTAITYNSYGSTVFVVDDKGRDPGGRSRLVARQVFVTTGPTRGDQVAIVKGVQEGETVVTAGQIKLYEGSAVTIDNAVTPTDDPAPTPQER